MSFKFTYLRQPLNKYTFIAPGIRCWVEDHCKGLYVLNLFAGPTRLRGCIEIVNDLDRNLPGIPYNMDALDLAKQFWEWCELFDVVLLDPPYSYRKSMELYHGNRNSKFKQILDIIPEILAPNGIVITFGYHSHVMGEGRGFRIRELCIISHGGAIRDTFASVEGKLDGDTIVSVEERIKIPGEILQNE